jgi:hypothetical protein
MAQAGVSSMTNSNESYLIHSSGKAEKFWIRNAADMPIASEGVLVHVVDFAGRLVVMMQVDEDTTSENLRDAIPLALSWRDKLLDYQGSKTNPLAEWSSMHERGVTYPELARLINHTIAEDLKEYLEGVPYRYEDARNLLTLMGDRRIRKQANAVLRRGLKLIQVQGGQPPFDISPITPLMVKNRIRAWRRWGNGKGGG